MAQCSLKSGSFEKRREFAKGICIVLLCNVHGFSSIRPTRKSGASSNLRESGKNNLPVQIMVVVVPGS